MNYEFNFAWDNCLEVTIFALTFMQNVPLFVKKKKTLPGFGWKSTFHSLNQPKAQTNRFSFFVYGFLLKIMPIMCIILDIFALDEIYGSIQWGN